MDPNAACRLSIHIPAYEQHVENGRHEYHDNSHKNWVRDRDTISLMDFCADLDDEIKHGRNQSLSVTFWDKIAGEYKEIVSNSTLHAAFHMYQDMRRLPLLVLVIIKPCSSVVFLCGSRFTCTIHTAEHMYCCGRSYTKDAHPSEPIAEARPASKAGSAKPAANIEESPANDDPLGEAADDDPWGEHAEIEYVGVDEVFHANLIFDDENDHDYIPDTDEEDNDDCAVDDEAGCEILDHVIDF
jgi:hypothetical protein